MIPKEIERLAMTPPEVMDPTLLEPRKHRVLVLASYCAGKNNDGTPNGCTDDLPCIECLMMCNVAESVVGVSSVIGGYDYLKSQIDSGLTVTITKD